MFRTGYGRGSRFVLLVAVVVSRRIIVCMAVGACVWRHGLLAAARRVFLAEQRHIVEATGAGCLHWQTTDNETRGRLPPPWLLTPAVAPTLVAAVVSSIYFAPLDRYRACAFGSKAFALVVSPTAAILELPANRHAATSWKCFFAVALVVEAAAAATAAATAITAAQRGGEGLQQQRT